jgi:hypothetical protein
VSNAHSLQIYGPRCGVFDRSRHCGKCGSAVGTPTGPCRPPGPQIATLPPANEAFANVAPALSYYDPYTGANTQRIQIRPPCPIPKWHPVRYW